MEEELKKHIADYFEENGFVINEISYCQAEMFIDYLSERGFEIVDTLNC